MKLSLLLLTLFLSSNLFAQKTVRRVDKSGNERQEYYVLKSDKRIRQGAYTEYGVFTSFPYCEGFYKNNLKDSLWRYYSYNHKLCTAGYYKDGKRAGTWVSYDFKGDRDMEYDYTTKQLLFLKKRDYKPEQFILSGQDTLKADLDRPALCMDNGTIGRIVATNMRYPANAKEKNIQGKVLIAFTIDTLGKVSNYRIKHGIGGGCEQEALRVVKLIDGIDWLPAMLGGKPVTVEYAMPLTFTLETD
jgi:TonB family protein